MDGYMRDLVVMANLWMPIQVVNRSFSGVGSSQWPLTSNFPLVNKFDGPSTLVRGVYDSTPSCLWRDVLGLVAHWSRSARDRKNGVSPETSDE